MIVDGDVEFVGSNAAAAKKVVNSALAKPHRSVTAELSPRKPGEAAQVSITAPGCQGEEVCFAITQDDLITVVTKGENNGRTPYHDGVVRAFPTVTLEDAGRARAKLTLPDRLVESSAHLVIFVQDRKTMRVLGATAMPLSTTPNTEPAALPKFEPAPRPEQPAQRPSEPKGP